MFFYYFCLIQSPLKKCTFHFDFWYISFCRLYIWFLSYQDFSKNDENSFSWNEFECQSIDSALDEEMLSDIKSFWDKHLPILMSVKNGYSYVAIGIGEFNNGKIFYGTEPEYEDVAIIANSFYEFKEKYISALNGKDCENFYQYII